MISLNYNFRRIIIALLFIISPACHPFSISLISDEGIDDEIAERKMGEWLEYLCSKECAGRFVGTQGNKYASEYITSQLKMMGYEPYKQTFFLNNVEVNNVIVTIPGINNTCIVLGAHYDGQFEDKYNDGILQFHYPAANDNASGVVTLLKIADDLAFYRNVAPKYTIKICFWDGEEFAHGSCFKGSSYFVGQQEMNGESCLYYQNLDSIGHNHEKGYNLYYCGDVAINRILPLLLNSSMEFVNVVEREKGKGSSDYVPFTKNGISAVSFVDYHSEGCPYTWHTVSDTPEHISLKALIKEGEIVEEILNSFCN